MADDTEFGRRYRSAKRTLFGGAKDINLPDENVQRKARQSMESLQGFAERARRLSEHVVAEKKRDRAKK